MTDLRKAVLVIITLILMLASIDGCSPPAEPPPDEPPTTTVTTVPPESPPPTTTAPIEPPSEPVRAPEDYPVLNRTPAIVEDLTAALQQNAWAGWRDPLYVADKCAWALAPNADALFPMTHGEMQDFARAGAALDAEGAGFVGRLPLVNKRCNASHPEHDPRYCGRSDVLRSRLTEFRGRLTAHLEVARSLGDGLQGEPGHGSDWDSIKGWCESQRQKQ